MTGDAFDRVLNELGSAIVAGRVPPGHVESVDAIVERTGVSRSIVREAVRVLVAIGLLFAGRRVGLRVLPAESWDVLSPHVVRWRLLAAEAASQVAELQELRRAIEPAAAALAASRRTSAEAVELLEAAAELETARDADEFLAADRRFHALLLASSRNAMFVRLQDVVGEALQDRARGTANFPPRDTALSLHRAIAVAVQQGRSTAASDACEALIVTGAVVPAAR